MGVGYLSGNAQLCSAVYDAGAYHVGHQLFVAARNALADRRRRQRAYAELAALDDRSLADIGIHRSQIPAIVDEAACSARKAKKDHAALPGSRPVNPLDFLPQLGRHVGRRAG